MKRFELVDGASSKFWEIGVEGVTVTVRFGRIGTAGQTKVKACASAAAASAEHDKLIREKTGKGYVAVGSAPAARLAPLPPDDAPEEVVELRALAASACAGDEPLTRVYILMPGAAAAATATAERGVTRAGGPPIGVTEATRPRYDGAFMQHLITLDVDAMPELRAVATLAAARAVAVFISDAMDNNAFEPGATQTRVVALGADEVARGEWSGPPVTDPPARALTAWPLDVPTRVFAVNRYADDVDEDDLSPIYELRDELMSANRAAGSVIHWSGETRTAGFLFQFTEDLVEANFGDAGTMYVYDDDAYWVGH